MNDPLEAFYDYCESAEDVIFARIMAQHAEEWGMYFLQENERLKQDPDAAVPEDVTQRMLEVIRRAFDKKQSE